MEITNHAKQRYSERIMDKDSKLDVTRFIVENEEKIKTDIGKMIDYGQLIYEGYQKRDGKTNHISVYLKDSWVVLCDPVRETVITLYKVDLGLDDDFNKMYIEKMLEKITCAKNRLLDTKSKLDDEIKNYQEIIDDNNSMINEYRGYIKNLEELNEGYQKVISSNYVSIDVLKRELADAVNSLIGKKEF